MASTTGSTTLKAGLRNTIRFRWVKKNASFIQREAFGRMMLMGQLKLKVEHVYCLQTNMQEKSYDVTFSSQGVADNVLEVTRAKAGEKPFSDFEVLNLDRPNFRVVTVHMYNPYVTREQIAAFLSAYGEVFPGSRRIMDPLGYWTGRTQFHVLLKEDRNGIEGMAHPPAFFYIAADRGFLFYSRQPQFCRKCKRHGHTEGACGFVWCRDCKAYGHETRDCPFPKACHGCGKIGHVNKDCPERKPSYAEAASTGQGVEEEEGLTEVDGAEGISPGRLQQQEEVQQGVGSDDPLDAYFTGSESEAMEEQHSPAQRKKSPRKKKGGVRRVKKADLTVGNGQKNGEGQRAFKRAKVDEGEKKEKVVGGGLEGQDSGGGGEVELVEGSQRDSGGGDLVPLTLGQDLVLPPLVSPVQSENEGEGGQPRKEGTKDWGDSEPPEGDVVDAYYS